MQLRGLPGEDFGSVSGWFGVELGWWFGLDRSRLALPVDEAYERE